MKRSRKLLNNDGTVQSDPPAVCSGESLPARTRCDVADTNRCLFPCVQQGKAAASTSTPVLSPEAPCTFSTAGFIRMVCRDHSNEPSFVKRLKWRQVSRPCRGQVAWPTDSLVVAAMLSETGAILCHRASEGHRPCVARSTLCQRDWYACLSCQASGMAPTRPSPSGTVVISVDRSPFSGATKCRVLRTLLSVSMVVSFMVGQAHAGQVLSLCISIATAHTGNGVADVHLGRPRNHYMSDI